MGIFQTIHIYSLFGRNYMANSKKEKFDNLIQKLPTKKTGDKDLLSKNLPQDIGSLSEREKITIRLDSRILDKVKKESEKTGVGYQKIINVRLLDIYKIQKASYLEDDKIEKLEKRIRRLEQQILREA